MNNRLHTPHYDRGNISAGIAHIGVGNFHRSHQARYLHELMNQGLAMDWGIVGIGLLPGDMRMRDALRQQNYAYTLVEKHSDGTTTAERIGSIIDMVLATESTNAVMNVLTDPSIRIVSLTITEGGYNITTDGVFDLDNPAVQADLRTPAEPSTVFGFITEALRVRRKAGTQPFTVMSCDNLPGNGDITRLAITSYANALDPDLATWIEANVSFPNGMVDRITPVTTDADREYVRTTFGVEDAWPVMSEPFSQWVLEDHFVAGRPHLEHVGVQLVPDVVPYELMKLRLLNATHQAMAYIGILAGYEWVHDAVTDGRVRAFLQTWLAEARQTLPAVTGVDLDAYCQSLLDRFGNPHIADTLARLAVDASERIPKFVLPAVSENLAQRRSAAIGAILLASWARYLERAESAAAVNDPGAQALWELVHSPPGEAAAFLDGHVLFGDINNDDRFRKEFTEAYQALQQLQPLDALEELLGRF